ncbi:MAG: hypothetical protein AAB649_07055 [Patescibacteria group bacterium]
MAYPTFFAKIAVVLLFATLVAGQIIRFSLPGQGGGILISDIAVVVFLLVAALSLPSPVLGEGACPHCRAGGEGFNLE